MSSGSLLHTCLAGYMPTSWLQNPVRVFRFKMEGNGNTDSPCTGPAPVIFGNQ